MTQTTIFLIVVQFVIIAVLVVIILRYERKLEMYLAATFVSNAYRSIERMHKRLRREFPYMTVSSTVKSHNAEMWRVIRIFKNGTHYEDGHVFEGHLIDEREWLKEIIEHVKTHPLP